MSSYYSNNLRILVGALEPAANRGKLMAVLPDGVFNIRIRNPKVTPTIEADDEASKYATGDHGEDESIMGSRSAKIEFSVKTSATAIGDSSTDDDYPAWWKFAQACGCHIKRYKTTAPAPIRVLGFALQPRRNSDIETMNILVYDIPRNFDSATTPMAMCYKFAGCMGNMVIGAEGVGKPWTATFSMSGKLMDIAEIGKSDVPELEIDDTTVSEKLLNYGLSLNGESRKISTFKLDPGHEISPVLDQSDETGFLYYSVTKRSPRFSCNPLMDNSFDDLYAKWKNESAFGIELKSNAVPPTPPPAIFNNGYTLYIPKAQQLSAAIASREGLIDWELNCKALRRLASEIPAGSGMDPDADQEVTWELLTGKRLP